MDEGLLHLSVHPALRRPHLIVAFAGWPDAGEVATGALRYVIATYRASKLGQISNDPFFDFSVLRPLAVVERGETKQVRFPANDLYYRQDPSLDHDFIFLLATEPHLRWEAYTQVLMGVVDEFDVSLVLVLGSMFDAVPHTREPRISGVATTPVLRHVLREHGIRAIDYQGPASYHNMVQRACEARLIDSVALWAHTPVYVRAPSNPKVSWTLLNRLGAISYLNIDLADLYAAGEYLNETLDRLLQENQAIRSYVRQLEEVYDSGGTEVGGGMHGEGTDQIIRDVEEFLRRDHRRRGGDGSP